MNENEVWLGKRLPTHIFSQEALLLVLQKPDIHVALFCQRQLLQEVGKHGSWSNRTFWGLIFFLWW